MFDRPHTLRAAAFPPGGTERGARQPSATRAASDDAPDCTEDTAFALRVAAPLRRAERAAPDFERRLMAAVRADMALQRAARAPSPSEGARGRRWPRALHRSPLAGLAAAAVVAAVAALGSSGALGTPSAARGPVTSPVVGRADSAGAARHVHVVRFTVAAPQANRVALVGAFNGWAKDATPLRPVRGADSLWTVSVALPEGRHEFAFLVDGERWIVDSRAPTRRDEYGIQSSVLTVGGDAGYPARRS